ncbi:MAG: hypothetical protein ACLTNW_16760 [Mediterraneibacter gnavus]
MGRFDEKIMLVTGATPNWKSCNSCSKRRRNSHCGGAQRRAWSGCCSSNGRSWWKRRIHEMHASNKDAVKALCRNPGKYGKLDVAVNNAGIVGASRR